ncbi:glycine betaine ABC transporter substrate-binding protein [Ideonella livida]
MTISTFKTFAIKVAMVTTAFGAGLGAAHAAEPLKIAYTNWADVLATVHVAKYVLETKMAQPVKLVNADIGIQYQSVARGDVEAMLGGWLPVTHGAYVDKHKANMEDLGVIYAGGKNGWAVPAYIPESELSTIADLAKPEVRAKLGGTIQGIEPGGGLMRASEAAIQAYGLNTAGYKLQSSSEAGMLAAVSRAYQSKQWVVATTWSPHWMFQKWELRYLKDPKGSLGGEEQVHGFGSKQLAGKFPKAHAFLKSFKMDLRDIELIQNEGQASNNYEAAARKFVEANPDKVKAWLPK